MKTEKKFCLGLMLVCLAGLTAFAVLTACQKNDDCNCDDDDDDQASDDDGDNAYPQDDDAVDDDNVVDDDAVTDDDAATDDDLGDDDSGAPTITDFSNGKCKNGAGPDKADDDWPPSVEFDYADGILTVTFINGMFNCCLDYVEVTMELTGLVIDLYEQEVAPNPCYCECPFDVETQIANLAAGTYTVNIYDNGTFAVSGQTTIP